MDVTLLGVLAVSWVLGWLGARPPEVNRAVRAFRALMAHRRLTGLVVRQGFLALYFWTQRVRVRSGLPHNLVCPWPHAASPAPLRLSDRLCDPV